MTPLSDARASASVACQHKICESNPLYRKASLGSRPSGSVPVVSDAVLLSDDLLLEGLNLRSGQRVLDLHCETGHLALHLAMKYQVEVVGLCPDGTQAQVARRLAKRQGVAHLTQFQTTNSFMVRFPDAHFDAVISQDAFECALDIDLYAMEIARVLRKGGQWRGMDAFGFAPIEGNAPRTKEVTEEGLESNARPMWSEVERAFHRAGIAPLITHELTPDIRRAETALHALSFAGPRHARIEEMSNEEIEDSELMAACAILGSGILDGSIKYILVGGIKN